MNTEQKAQAYDKALEIARQYYEKDSMNAFLDTIFPELAESEDERIRKRLIEYFEGFRMGNAEVKWEGLNVQEVLVWLEKQKECVSNNFDGVWNEEDCEEIIAEGQKLTPRFKELLKEVCHAWYDRGAKLEKQKERKPEEKPINWTELTWEDINYLEDLMAKVHYEFRNGIGAEGFGKEVLEKFREYKEDEYTDEKEQKSAEWSEDDENVYKTIMDDFNGITPMSKAYKLKAAKWLKSILERCSLQPKQEWSEEQMRGLAHAINLDVYDAKRYGLDSLYNDLKKLM